MPERIQLSRRKGWRMPPNTVSVARPGRWGNPFQITHEECDQMNDDGMCWVVRHKERLATMHATTKSEAAAVAVEEFASWLRYGRLAFGVDDVQELRGKNLACWCRIDQPCHADVLLEIANRPADVENTKED